MTNNRGVSPVIATILLILIAVAAGVVVYTYAIGWLGTSSTQADVTQSRIQIDLASYNATSQTVTVYYRNTGDNTATISMIYIMEGSQVKRSETINVDLPPNETTNSTFDVGQLTPRTYNAKIVAEDGATHEKTFKVS